MRSWVDKENECLILLCNGYVYSVPYRGDWVLTCIQLADGIKANMPNVQVLGLDVELLSILQKRGLQYKW